MVLVAYSDSEGSDNEQPRPHPQSQSPRKSEPTKPAQKSSSGFAVDKSNPKKIRVNLNESLPQPSSGREDGEPAAKRPRVGAGPFSGFNAMLPAPKRDNAKPEQTNGSKAPARKVFSLKTGAEPAFSREADAALKDLFAEDGQESTQSTESISTIPAKIPKPNFVTTQTQSTTSATASGKPFMFKPLSVARSSKKKKVASHNLPPQTSSTSTQGQTAELASQSNHIQQPIITPSEPQEKTKKKISLFSSGPPGIPPDIPDLDPEELDDFRPSNEDEGDEIIEVLDDPLPPQTHATPSKPPDSLHSLADNLNLSAAERRQLLGRNGTAAGSASKIVNFNTDVEYAANQAHIAAGEQIQHNPVRAIAPGKHSLKQLISSAQGQKDALEESFAAGRKNKREAGSKYGW